MPAPMSSSSAARDVWAAHYSTPDGYRFMPNEEVVRFAARGWFNYRDRVLEVGCGNGANLWHLAERSGGAVGLDFCLPALTEARDLCASRGCGQETRDSKPGHRCYKSPAHLTQGDAASLPFIDSAFDAVVDCMTSQHLPWESHGPLYREYRRVLRPGGRFFLYHLTSRTTGATRIVPDYPNSVPLFPVTGMLCLPRAPELAARVALSGFFPVELRGLAREYSDGAVAHYAVVEGTAQ